MPIKSYLVYPHAGKKEHLINALKDQMCEVIPAENKELLIVVTDTKDQNEEDNLLRSLNEIESLDHYTLVAGFKD